MEARVDDHSLTELAPDLQIIRPLGQGSTATVYLAKELGLNRAVAVKVLHPQFLGDRIALRRFEREAQSAALISHTNVTSIYRVGRLADGRPFIVMEYIDGRSLADMMAARGPLPIEEVRNIVAAMASALAAAHAKGIVHRDVNPGNIFIENRTGRVVLADFGIAGLLDAAISNATRLTGVGQWLGDVRYSSPEHLRGEPVTEQSDVYALGLVAFEMVAGRGPFDPASVMQLVTAHLQQPAPPLTEFRPEMDRELARVLNRCLAKEPNQRPRATDIPSLVKAAGYADALGVNDVGDFLKELKRRRVFQTGIAYATGSFIILEGAGNVLPTFEGGGAYDVLVAVAVAGFPVALVVSWIYDIRHGRLSRTADGQNTGRMRVLPWLGLAFSLVISGVVLWHVLKP